MTATSLPGLHLMSLGELLDRAFRLYRKNFFTFIGIVAFLHRPRSVGGKMDISNNISRAS